MLAFLGSSVLVRAPSDIVQKIKENLITLLSRKLVEFETDIENRKDCMYIF